MDGPAVSKLEYALGLCEHEPMGRRPPGMTRAFRDIVEAIESAGVAAALCGAFARNVYLRPRFTDDVDFLVRDLDDLAKIAAAAEPRFEVPRPLDPITRIVHLRAGVKVDLISAEYAFELDALDHPQTCPVYGRVVRVVPPEHLTAMKVDAASDPTRPEDFGEAVRLLLSGVDVDRVSAFVRRDVPSAVPTLEAILRAVQRARSAPPKPSGRRR